VRASGLVRGLLLLAALAYPFVVYNSLGRVPAYWLLTPLALLWLLRAHLGGAQEPGGRWVPALAALACLILAVADSHASLRIYPVVVNVLMMTVFGSSLLRGRPVIERIARLRHPDLPPEGVRYTRQVTQVWTAFFLLNGLAAAALGLWGSWYWWTLYNGLISYLLMGLLMVGEWLLRPTPPEAPSP